MLDTYYFTINLSVISHLYLKSIALDNIIITIIITHRDIFTFTQTDIMNEAIFLTENIRRLVRRN